MMGTTKETPLVADILAHALSYKRKHQTYNIELIFAIARMQTQKSNKRNVVLYLDKELIEKSHIFGFNLSKTFENHLKHLINRFSTVNSVNNQNSTGKSSRAYGSQLNYISDVENVEMRVPDILFQWWILRVKNKKVEKS